MNVVLLRLCLSTAALLVGSAITWWIHRHHQIGVAVPVAPPEAAGVGPLISVIVPARNEARNIRRCVTALLAQTYPRLEVIVVDDHSTDATPSILEELAAGDARLRAVAGVPLPAGWA